ncbi:hypothetical protein HMPREF9694_04277 [Klebsiella michiganensis]|nr:hypothetical protein HMPREF9694_04277 [Klebsiella michiganensis]
MTRQMASAVSSSGVLRSNSPATFLNDVLYKLTQLLLIDGGGRPALPGGNGSNVIKLAIVKEQIVSGFDQRV